MGPSLTIVLVHEAISTLPPRPRLRPTPIAALLLPFPHSFSLPPYPSHCMIRPASLFVHHQQLQPILITLLTSDAGSHCEPYRRHPHPPVIHRRKQR